MSASVPEVPLIAAIDGAEPATAPVIKIKLPVLTAVPVEILSAV